MFMESYLEDNQLAEFLRKEIAKCAPNVKMQLKTIGHCGSRLMKTNGVRSGVVLLSNGKHTKFSGSAYCCNVFCCPHCQGRLMPKYSNRIKIALDAMSKAGYKAIMATFTFPHLNFLTCRDGVLMLAQMKKNFLKKTKGTTVTKFFEDVGIKHYIWSAEFTHGGNGWHPHYHVLFWVKADRWDRVAKWEPILKNLWLSMTKRYMKQLKPNFAQVIDKLYAKANNERGGIYFSKTKKGFIREVTSANYLTGWSTNKELTQLEHKKAAKGHRTPRQLLQAAYDGSKTALKLYIEYCMAVTTKPRIRRVQYSKGLLTIVRPLEYLQKTSEVAVKKKDYVAICWFTPEQWRYICYECPTYTRSNILFLARFPDLLFNYLDELNIGYELPGDEPLCKIVTDLNNNAA